MDRRQKFCLTHFFVVCFRDITIMKMKTLLTRRCAACAVSTSQANLKKERDYEEKYKLQHNFIVLADEIARRICVRSVHVRFVYQTAQTLAHLSTLIVIIMFFFCFYYYFNSQVNIHNTQIQMLCIVIQPPHVFAFIVCFGVHSTFYLCYNILLDCVEKQGTSPSLTARC